MHSLARVFPASPSLVRFFLIAAIACSLFSFSVPKAQAAGLTEPQIQAILTLLVSFDVDEATINGVSNILHGTTPPGPVNSITVTAPNGGEQWETGITNTVTWAPYGYNPDINPAKDVTAYLDQKNGDGSFTTVGKVQEEGKASIHWLTGHLDPLSQEGHWTQPGNNYYIRVVNNVTGATDRSDTPFTILPRSVSVLVNGSDGPATIDPNQKVWVSWSSTNKNSCTAFGISDTQVSNGGNQPQITNLPTSGKREVYVWFWDTSYGTSISVQCSDASGNVAADWVQVNATAQSASLRVTSPNGGENIQTSAPYDITWSQTGVNRVSVALYKNDMWYQWVVKDMNSAGDGKQSLQWMPKDVLAGTGQVYKIYITGQRNDGTGYVDDKSDGTFSFINSVSVAPTISVVSPNAGGTFTIGSSYNTGDFLPYSIHTTSVTTDGTMSVYLTDRNSADWKSGKYYLLNSSHGWQPNAQPIMEGSTQMANYFTPGSYYVLGTWQGNDGTNLSDFSNQPVTLVSSTILGALIISDPSVNFNVVQGASNPPVYILHLTNGSSASVTYTLSMPNQPGWLNTGYNTQPMILNPGEVAGIGASVDASKVSSPGTYTTNLIIRGNFTNSPIIIPITLTVTANAQQSYTFVATPSYGTAPLAVQFGIKGLNLSGSPTEYRIYFGDNSPLQSISSNVIGGDVETHTYTQSGAYTAHLNKVTNPWSETEVATTIITVTAPADTLCTYTPGSSRSSGLFVKPTGSPSTIKIEGGASACGSWCSSQALEDNVNYTCSYAGAPISSAGSPDYVSMMASVAMVPFQILTDFFTGIFVSLGVGR